MTHIKFSKSRNFLINLSECKRFRLRSLRFIKKLSVFFIIFCIVFDLSFSAYANTYTPVLDLGGGLPLVEAGAAVAAIVSADAFIPLCLCALGIAGVGFICNRPDIINTITETVENTYSDAVVKIKDSSGVVRRYYKTTYKNAKNYINQSVLKVIAKSALDMGLFNGVTSSGGDITLWTPAEGEIIPINSLQTIESSQIVDLYDLAIKGGQLLGLSGDDLINYNVCLQQLIDSGLDAAEVNGRIGSISYRASWKRLSVSYIYDIGSDAFPVSFKVNTVYEYDNNTVGYASAPAYNTKVYQAQIGTSPYIYTQAGSILVGQNGIAASSFPAIGNGKATISNVVYDGIPITDNIPVEEDGDLVLPDWAYPTVDDPAAEGVTDFPVSLPDDYPIPAIWDPAIDPTYPDVLDGDYDWPDDIPADPAIPDDNAQDEAQEGDTDYIPSLPGIDTGTEGSFFVPEGIVNKYPFCIPFDMYRAVTSLAVARAAPQFTWNYNIAGMEGSVSIDLSRWDSAAVIFRRCEFAVFVIGLIAGSKNLLGDK